MSLPLPYRPQRVLDLMEEERASQQRASLKLVVNKNEVFLACMMQWYRKMSKKQRSVLTKKKLIKRATLEAHRLNIPSASLPQDWMDTMSKECGLVCYISKNALNRRQKREETRMMGALESEVEVSAMETETDGQPEAKRSKDMVDLTWVEPPQAWTLAQERGNPERRHLAIASTETSNILYWDYDLSHWNLDQDPSTMTRDPSQSPTNPAPYNEWAT